MKNACIFGGLMLGMLTLTALMMDTLGGTKPSSQELTARHEKTIREHFSRVKYKSVQNTPFTFEETEGGIYVIYTVTTPNGAYKTPSHNTVKDFVSSSTLNRDVKITKKNF